MSDDNKKTENNNNGSSNEHDNNIDYNNLNVYEKEAAEYKKAAAEVFGEEKSTKAKNKNKNADADNTPDNDEPQNNNNDNNDKDGEKGSLFASDSTEGVKNDLQPTGNNNNDNDNNNNQTPDNSAVNNDGERVKILESEIESLKDELEKTQQKMRSWNGRIRKANERAKHFQKKCEDLKIENAILNEAASKTSNGTNGDNTQESDKEVLDRFKTEFPELVDVINVLQRHVENVEKKVNSKNNSSSVPDKTPAAGKTDDDIDDFEYSDEDFEKYNKNNGSSASSGFENNDKEPTEHYKIISSAHPDIDEIVNSGVLATWIRKQADFIKPHLEHIYQSGTAKQVVDMIAQFKKTTGWKSQLEINNTTQSDSSNAERQKKLDAMRQVKSEGGGPPPQEKPKDDFYGTAKEIGLI